MRVLTVNMTLDARTGGGSAARTLHFTRALRDRGVACAIATNQGPEPGVELRDVPIILLPAAAGRFRVPYAGWRTLRDAVARADVVLLVNHWTAVNFLAWRAARRAGKPWVVCPAGALPVAGRSRVGKRLYNALGGRRIVCDAAGHVAVTNDERADFAAYGVEADRVSVVPNGMPSIPAGDAAAFRARFHVGPSPLVLFVGRLAPIKGADLLIDAFSRGGPALAGWQLVLAGPDDGQRDELVRRVVASPAAERLHLVGFVDAAARSDALAAADLVVVPSRREAMSIVVLEAAAAGRPVVVTEPCGVPEVAEAGGGWVVEASVNGLAEGLRAAAAARDNLPAMGARWRRFAADRFAWPRVAAQLEAVLAAAASGRSR